MALKDAPSDKISLRNVESVIGSDADDEIYSSNSECWIQSGAGTDTIFGGAGRQFLFGGDNSDILHGDNDADVDILVGGDGADDFYIGANDTRASRFSSNAMMLNGRHLTPYWERS